MRVESLELRFGVSVLRTRFIHCPVGRGDLTPPKKASPKGEAFHAVYPLGRITGMAARAAYMPPLPTNP